MKSLARKLIEKVEALKEDVNQSVQQGMDSIPEQPEQNQESPNQEEINDLDDYSKTSSDLA